MWRAIRGAVLLALLVPAGWGCGPSKSEAEPNPDLKVPDIPPSGHGAKDVSKGNKKK